MPITPIKIFISHAHTDRLVAEALIAYLLEEFTLSKQDIRCTSVPGYMIPAGQFIVDRLRKDVDAGIGFICLLSYFGLDSTWVKFELGAAWVKERSVIPILGPGFEPGDNRLGPIGAMPCVQVDSPDCRPILEQFIDQMAQELGIARRNSKKSSKKLDLFIKTYIQWGGEKADFTNTEVKIISPTNDSEVRRNIKVKFDLKGVPEDGFIWIAILEKSTNKIWPKENLSDPQRPGEHNIEISEGGGIAPSDAGICIIGVGNAGNNRLNFWRINAERTASWGGIEYTEKQIPGLAMLDSVTGLSVI